MIPIHCSAFSEDEKKIPEGNKFVFPLKIENDDGIGKEPKKQDIQNEINELKTYEKHISLKKHDIDETKLENLSDLDNDESMNNNLKEKLGKMNLVLNPIPAQPKIPKMKLLENSKLFEVNSSEQIKKNKDRVGIENIINNHSYRHLIFAPYCTESTFKKHLLLTYRGLVYSKKCLKGPSESFIKSKQVNLVESKGFFIFF